MTNKFMACSSMKLTSLENKPYWFRTCDFHSSIWEDGAHIVSFPEGITIDLSGNVLAKTKYKVLGVTDNDKDTWLLDGINSEGLTGGVLMFYEGTSVPCAKEDYIGIMGMELLTYLLALCKDVDEVAKAVENIQILNVMLDGNEFAATAHYFFADANGKSIILEADDKSNAGIINVYTDNIGIMTNSPSYSDQLDNLRWFISQSPELSAKGIGEMDFEGFVIRADKNARHMCRSGTLPASFASYDRFVRLAIMKFLNDCGRTIEDKYMLSRGTGIINTVFEPRNKGVFHYFGFDGDEMPQKSSDGYTQYIVMYDISERVLHIQPSDSVKWTAVSLSECATDSVDQRKIDI